MSDIDILREMLHANAIVEPIEKNGKAHIILSEQNAEVSYQVAINGLSSCHDFIVIKADMFELPDKFFQNTQDQYKRADFVLVAELTNRKMIICIEMKATKDRENKIISQLKGAQCLTEYCKALGKAFWSQYDFLAGYTYYFVSIGQIKNSQKPEYKSTQILHHDPVKLLKILGVRQIQFKHLLAELQY